MGDCMSVQNQQRLNSKQALKVNPYGFQTTSQIQYPDIQTHPYFGAPTNNYDTKIPHKHRTTQQFVQNDKKITALTQKISQQNHKINEQQNIIKKLNKTNTNNNTNQKVVQKQNQNIYEGCYNYGKNNIIKWQGICPQCKIKRMQRFLDYDNNKTICKCEGYGCIQGKKIKKKCEEWFCGHKIKPFQICTKCYGYGFKSGADKDKGKSFFNLF